MPYHLMTSHSVMPSPMSASLNLCTTLRQTTGVEWNALDRPNKKTCLANITVRRTLDECSYSQVHPEILPSLPHCKLLTNCTFGTPFSQCYKSMFCILSLKAASASSCTLIRLKRAGGEGQKGPWTRLERYVPYYQLYMSVESAYRVVKLKVLRRELRNYLGLV